AASAGEVPSASRRACSRARWYSSSSARAAASASARHQWMSRRSIFMSGLVQHPSDGFDELLELSALVSEAFAAGACQRVVPRPAIVLRGAPVTCDPAIQQEAL